MLADYQERRLITCAAAGQNDDRHYARGRDWHMYTWSLQHNEGDEEGGVRREGSEFEVEKS
jgi:hypothetical protein